MRMGMCVSIARTQGELRFEGFTTAGLGIKLTLGGCVKSGVVMSDYITLG